MRIQPVAVAILIFASLFTFRFQGWKDLRMEKENSLSESVVFFNTLEMAGEKILEGKPWPGRHFGVGKLCRPQGHPIKGMLNRTHISLSVSGNGIEIGALHSKFPAGAQAHVKYVDSRSITELQAHYPELAGADLVSPDIIDEAETLRTLLDGSQDFVIASHVLEHTDRVILSIKNQLRVLRSGGIAVLMVPMRCSIFDQLRSVTSWEHLLDEYYRPDALNENREEHFREWALSTAHRSIPTELISENVKRNMARDGGKGYSIHFHVWDHDSFRNMIENLITILHFPFEVRDFEVQGYEALAVLQKL